MLKLSIVSNSFRTTTTGRFCLISVQFSLSNFDAPLSAAAIEKTYQELKKFSVKEKFARAGDDNNVD